MLDLTRITLAYAIALVYSSTSTLCEAAKEKSANSDVGKVRDESGKQRYCNAPLAILLALALNLIYLFTFCTLHSSEVSDILKHPLDKTCKESSLSKDTYHPVLCCNYFEEKQCPWYLEFNNNPIFTSHYQNIYVYPASFETYFSEILNLKDKPSSDVMKYEWARYESFKDFPVSSPAIPMRLSQAGFYYTGKEDETACFSCGFQYKRWTSGESPFVVHQTLSPACLFITGKDTTNVPIDSTKKAGTTESSNNVSSVTRTDSSSGSITSHETVGGAAGGPCDIQQPIRNESARVSRSSDPIQSHVTTSSTTNQRDRDTELRYQDNTCNTEPLGISFERPKRPEFAVLAVRISSFKGWPRSVQQQPHELAEAGFCYAGYGDCVRCFHCGGGLRNWEYGDEPWTEHARWYPRCAHVRLCKGDEYVETIQQELQEIEAASSLNVVNNITETQPQQTHEPVSNEKALNPMDRVAALSVIDIGYGVDTVRRAVETFQSQIGNSNFTAQDLMELILDAEENTNNEVGPTVAETVQIQDQKDIERVVPEKLMARNDNHREKEKKALNTEELSETFDVKKSLLDENRLLKEQMTCKICLDGEACVVFLPCSHMVACPQCAPALRKCPVCRKLVRGTVRAYLS